MIEKWIDVQVPVSVAYNQWTQFREFPRFMEGVEEVRQLGDRHLHWRTNVGGKREEWDAEITEQIPDKRIAWHAKSGAPNAGTCLVDCGDPADIRSSFNGSKSDVLERGRTTRVLGWRWAQPQALAYGVGVEIENRTNAFEGVRPVGIGGEEPLLCFVEEAAAVIARGEAMLLEALERVLQHGNHEPFFRYLLVRRSKVLRRQDDVELRQATGKSRDHWIRFYRHPSFL